MVFTTKEEEVVCKAISYLVDRGLSPENVEFHLESLDLQGVANGIVWFDAKFTIGKHTVEMGIEASMKDTRAHLYDIERISDLFPQGRNL